MCRLALARIRCVRTVHVRSRCTVQTCAVPSGTAHMRQSVNPGGWRPAEFCHCWIFLSLQSLLSSSRPPPLKPVFLLAEQSSPASSTFPPCTPFLFQRHYMIYTRRMNVVADSCWFLIASCICRPDQPRSVPSLAPTPAPGSGTVHGRWSHRRSETAVRS